jgi:hypothetical protein
MKKWLLVLVFAFSSAFAADLNLFNESSKAWLGAVTGATGLRFDTPIILPSQDLILTAESCRSYSETWQGDFATIKNLTTLLGSSIKGISDSEWLMLSVDFGCGSRNETQVLVRIKGADLAKGAAWEVWVNGKKQ